MRQGKLATAGGPRLAQSAGAALVHLGKARGGGYEVYSWRLGHRCWSFLLTSAKLSRGEAAAVAENPAPCWRLTSDALGT